MMTLMPIHDLAWLLLLESALFGCCFAAGRLDRAAARDRRADRAAQALRARLAPPPQHARVPPSRIEQVNRLALLDDAFAYAEQKLTAQQVTAEAAAIWAEVEAHPEQWQIR